MALRYEVTDTVQQAVLTSLEGSSRRVLTTGDTLNVTIRDLLGNNLTVFANETGAATAGTNPGGNPLTSTATGVIPAWVRSPDYDLLISGSNINSTLSIRTSPPGVVYPESYGAVGDGNTNDYAAVAAAVAATPTGGTLRLSGMYKLGSTLMISKQIKVEGGGIGTGFMVAVGTSADGVVFDSGTSGLLYGLLAKDFSVLGGSSSARYAVVVRNIAHSSFEDVWVKAGTSGTGYGVSIEGALINYFKLIVPGSNGVFPYSATPPQNGIRVVGSTQYPANANWLDCIAEGHAGNGLLVDGTIGLTGEFDNWISGTYEGNNGYGIYLKACRSYTIQNAYLEGALAANNHLGLEACQRGQVGPGVFNAMSTEIVGGSNLFFEGFDTNGITTDATAVAVHFGERCNLSVNGGTVAFTDPAQVTSSKRLIAETTYNPPSLANGASATTTVTVTGAALGDTAVASHTQGSAGVFFFPTITSANTVSVAVMNLSGGVVDLASGTLRVEVTKRVPS